MTAKRSWLSAGVAATTAILGLVAVALILATLSVAMPQSWGFRGAPLLFGATCGTVGFVVARNRPENSIGWIFAAIGFLFAIEGVVEAYTVAAILAVPGGLPGEPAIGWLMTWLWVPAMALALVYLPLLFPTGHLLTRRWRAVAVLGALSIFVFSAATAISPGPIVQATYLDNPFTPFAIDRSAVVPLQGAALVPLVLSIGVAIVSLILRFRGADDIARRQIKWFALAGAVAAAAFGVYDLSYLFNPAYSVTKVFELLVIASLLAMPVTAGMAILRYHLYEIDRVISRTVGWAIVTGLLVAVFASAVVTLQALLAPFTNGSTLAVAGSTVVAFALFQPLRRRVQRAVDRRFDRARYDRQRTVDAFAEHLRSDVDLGSLRSSLAATANRAVRPTSAAVWLSPRARR